MQADHINGNGLDNRRSNLRAVTRSENYQNRIRRRANPKYRFKGVTQFNSKSTYSAYIQAHAGAGSAGRLRVNGFKTQEEAAMAYNVLARKLFGQYASLNQVDMG